MNDTSEETIEQIQEYLQAVKENAYSFETDSAKADMITGKVVAGYQWSGDPCIRWIRQKKMIFIGFCSAKRKHESVFYGWCMLKNGIKDSAEKKQAAEGLSISFQSLKMQSAIWIISIYVRDFRRGQSGGLWLY